MPVVAKVNAAHPLMTDVRIAQERFIALLADDPKTVEAAHAQIEARMTLRALACSQNVSIGRFDAVASVRALPLDPTCFQAQDKELRKFYGLKTIGVLMAKPPLRPLKQVGMMTALPKGKLTTVVFGTFARDAGVAVVRDSIGDAAVVEVPGGKVISTLPRKTSTAEHTTRLSPNGRVLAVNAMLEGPTFFETETGNPIWEAGDGSYVLTWLPEVTGFVLATRDGVTMLADAQTGTTEPHPLAPKNSSFSAHIPGPPARALIGTARELVLVQHARTPKGIEATAIKQYAIGPGPGITSGNPVPMRSGAMVVYASVRDIGWLDLESGASGTWRSSPYFGIPFAKLDETHLMFDSVGDDRLSLKPWSFDIANETVAPADLGGDRGLLINLGDRTGFMRRGNSEAFFGDAVKTGESQSLDKVVGAFELQRQIAKLQQEIDAERASAANATEAARATGLAEKPGRVSPELGDVPRDAAVYMVGVYEGGKTSGPAASHAPRPVNVSTRGGGRPVVLVLSSYEPVTWLVMNFRTQISAVLLSGPSQSTVAGVGSTPVIRIGSAYAYSAGGPEYQRLRNIVTRYTGPLEIRSFQGEYSASRFSIDGS